ncbi:Terminase-like family [Terriglobus roseus DSM 18391]|uniref:Terminase-like family n=2 Tax=Terriglobus roseus TaxID=392734 RepID=I3ZDZ0_TERRK|nr:Terminase-like family [Terriglobus roseus DSM 18391]
MVANEELSLNPFQENLMTIPESFDVFLGGGRGGGKSYGLAYLALRHAEQYGVKARILYLRKTYKGLSDFELVTRELFGKVYGTEAKYNAAEHVWRFPNGAYMELGQLETASDYTKYQGRSFTLLMIDEAGQFADPSLLDMMRSNLRGANKIPIRTVIAANPGGPGHHWIAKRYVFQTAPWTPFYEVKSKREWVYAPSTFDGNNQIDREQYLDQLESSCPDDPELLRAWRDGDWTVIRGAYFAECLSEERNAVPPWKTLPAPDEGWHVFLTHDFGSAAPSVTYVLAKSPGAEWEGRFYTRGSFVLVDELATHKPNNLAVGMGWNVDQTASAIRELCAKWDIDADGVADDAIFARTGASAGSIAEEFQRAGVHFTRAGKADRITGWQTMKRLLANAGKPDIAGLFISRSCAYFWATVPYVARDERRAEDVDTSSQDHGADACRYGILAREYAHHVPVKWQR